MENVNDASTYENGVADVIIHDLPDLKSPKSNIGQLKKEEVTYHVYTNQEMEIKDEINESITSEIEAEETPENHLVVSNNRKFQDLNNRPEDLPEYSRLIIRRDDFFKTLEDNPTATDQILKSKWTAFLNKTLRSENVTAQSLWIWRTIFIILVVTLALLLYFTRRPIHNHYHIYH